MRTPASGTPAHTQESPRFTLDHETLEAAQKAATEGYDSLVIASGCFDDLETLFKAIAAAADEHSQAGKLAKLGAYLASDWGNLTDCQRETMLEHLNALRAALGLPLIESQGGEA